MNIDCFLSDTTVLSVFKEPYVFPMVESILTSLDSGLWLIISIVSAGLNQRNIFYLGFICALVTEYQTSISRNQAHRKAVPVSPSSVASGRHQSDAILTKSSNDSKCPYGVVVLVSSQQEPP